MNKTAKNGFTLIEVLVVLVIISIIVTIATFGIGGARRSGRDAKRKSDLAAIQSALELYRSDCSSYPTAASNQVQEPIDGTGTPASCAVSNIYMSDVPTDPQTGRIYRYTRSAPTTYVLCANLETSPQTAIGACGGNCGGSNVCNYMVQNP